MSDIVRIEGHLFRPDSAVKRWEAHTYWDGHNNRDKNTRSQWDHQELLLSRTGWWILRVWSAWQGTRTHWRRLSASDAAEWLVYNGHELPESLSAHEPKEI